MKQCFLTFQLIKQNRREREAELSGEGGTIDNSMLWFIMHHIRRGRRRHEREARAARGENVGDDSSDTLSDEDLSTDEDSDSDGAPRDAMSCHPS